MLPKGHRLEFRQSSSTQLLFKTSRAQTRDQLDTAIQDALVVAYHGGRREGFHLL